MTRISIRKSGGANIISIPKSVLNALGLHTGSSIDLSLEGNKIILSPIKEKLTLDELIAGSPKKRLKMSKEDQQWLMEKSKGKEFK